MTTVGPLLKFTWRLGKEPTQAPSQANIWNRCRYQSGKRHGARFSPMGKPKYSWRGMASASWALFHSVPRGTQTLNPITAKYRPFMCCQAIGPQVLGWRSGKRLSEIYRPRVSLKSVFGSFPTTREPSGFTRSRVSAWRLAPPSGLSVAAFGFKKSVTYIKLAASSPNPARRAGVAQRIPPVAASTAGCHPPYQSRERSWPVVALPQCEGREERSESRRVMRHERRVVTRHTSAGHEAGNEVRDAFLHDAAAHGRTAEQAPHVRAHGCAGSAQPPFGEHQGEFREHDVAETVVRARGLVYFRSNERSSLAAQASEPLAKVSGSWGRFSGLRMRSRARDGIPWPPARRSPS